MKIAFAKQSTPKSGALAVLSGKGAKLNGAAKELDDATDGALGRAIKNSRYSGELGDTLEVLSPAGLDVSRVLLVGAGELAKLDGLGAERIGGGLVARLIASGETSLSIMTADDSTGAIAAHMGVGAALRAYRFDKYRTKEPASKKPSLKKVTVLCADPKAAETAFSRQAAVLEGVFFTRDLVSEPANILYPKSFAERTKGLSELGVTVEIIGESAMRKLGMGALLGVSQGSAHEPQTVIMRYDGTGKRGKTPPVALVGKGVTFDTGGISIKPAAGMEQMKWDMGGAGAVAGAMRALALRKAKAHVIGIVGLVENMPSGTAQRPGDVVTSMSGQTIEVINTDAEGRLVLCDALWYVQETYRPKAIVDLATLTGAMIISLGHEYAGCFSNDDALADQLLAAGKATGDRLWRFPLGDAYDKLINTPIADMKNVGPREGGSITAAQFLQRFIQNGTPWAHLDIAGTVWSEKDSATAEKGATGYGVRLLDAWIAAHHEDA
jgi:leucyl aminopeptidase